MVRQSAIAEVPAASVRRICLGTAQLGMRYGIVGRPSPPCEEEAIRLVRSALTAGVTTLDTARVYGNAEPLIGKALASVAADSVRVLTKLGPLDDLRPAVSDAELRRAVDASVDSSRRELGVEVLDTVMLHRWAHLRAFEGRIWRRLRELRESGIVRRLGVSVYHPDHALDALTDPDIQHIQLPFNVLDWRWTAASIETAVARRPDVVIHARSVFLQGLLLSSPSRWPAIADTDAVGILATLDSLGRSLGLRGRAELCMAFVLSHEWIDQVVMGVDSERQLQENLELVSCRQLTNVELDRVRSALPRVSVTLLDPSLWPGSATEQSR